LARSLTRRRNVSDLTRYGTMEYVEKVRSQFLSLRQVEHDPEKWKPVFPRDKRETRLSEIMLKQSDEIMMRFHFIAS